MARISELMIQNQDIKSFAQLVEAVKVIARSGERFLEFDVKPDYPDTPRGWEMKLEAAFYWADLDAPAAASRPAGAAKRGPDAQASPERPAGGAGSETPEEDEA